MDVAIGRCEKFAGLLKSHRAFDFALRNRRATVSGSGGAMRAHFEPSQFDGDVGIGGHEVERNPCNEVRRRIGMGNLLADGHFDLEGLGCLNAIGTKNDRNMFFVFPVGGLDIV